MAKPAAGTLVGSNSYTVNMRFAYLLNGASLSTQVNSVGGSEALLDTNATGITIVANGLDYTGSSPGIMQLPSAILTDFGSLSGATLMIRYKGPNVRVNPSRCGSSGNTDEMPFSDGSFYCGWLDDIRHVFTAPGLTYTNFNTLTVTAAASGNWKLYGNGTLYQTLSQNGVVSLGLSGWIGAGGFVGQIEFAYGWTRVLSLTEISNIASDPYTSTVFSGSAVNASDILTLTESVLDNVGSLQSYSDSISLSDTTTVDHSGARFPDSIVLQDLLDVSLDGAIWGKNPVSMRFLVSNTLFLSDNIVTNQFATNSVLISDALVFSDSRTSSSPYTTLVSDSMALVDTLSVGQSRNFVLADIIVFSDSLWVPTSSAGDSLFISDFVNYTLSVVQPTPVLSSVVDSFTFLDSIKLTLVPRIYMSNESIYLQDRVSVYMISKTSDYLRRYLNDVQI